MNMDDLKETARLAHLNMDDTELAGAYPAFEQMLGFFAAMRAADQDSTAMPMAMPAVFSASLAPLSAQTVDVNHFRLDTQLNNARHTAPEGLNSLGQDLLDNAGERDGRFIVVPNVL